jgi:hypothetical protein
VSVVLLSCCSFQILLITVNLLRHITLEVQDLNLSRSVPMYKTQRLAILSLGTSKVLTNTVESVFLLVLQSLR